MYVCIWGYLSPIILSSALVESFDRRDESATLFRMTSLSISLSSTDIARIRGDITRQVVQRFKQRTSTSSSPIGVI